MLSNVLSSIGAHYRRLLEISSKVNAANKASDMPFVLALDQLQGNRPKTLRRLLSIIKRLEDDKLAPFVGSLWLANSAISEDLSEFVRTRSEHARVFRAMQESMPSDLGHATYDTSSLAKSESLLRVMRATNNPFKQETAALQLLDSIATELANERLLVADLHPDGLRLQVASWDGIVEPKATQSIRVSKTNVAAKDARYRLPSWADNERALLYAIGRIIRSAMLGVVDFTASSAQRKQQLDGYCGVRTSWYKRQHGLTGHIELSEWEYASCSPWLESLLMHLLAWPGCRSDSDGDFVQVLSLQSLQERVRERIKLLAKMFGRSSSLPVYDVVVRNPLKNPPTISLALIQTVRPTHADLHAHGPDLNDTSFRPIHRNHLASLLRLTWEHDQLRSTYAKSNSLDIVVLPEIAVNRADLDLIERFIDATKAIVFCGLSFYEHERLCELINTGLWVLPEQRKTGRAFRYLLQGKEHMMKEEVKMQIKSYRPHQYILNVDLANGKKTVAVSGAICFDATDLKLASDLRDLTDMLIVPANNRDVPTFDTMASALSWHMFQHIVIVNSGEFGGSVVQAPYKERHQRTLIHDHGGMQAAISIVEIDLSDYQRMRESPAADLKSPPAGFRRH